MGRINLSALRVRKRALANLDTRQTSNRPAWLDIMADIPPAQIFTRQQPINHSSAHVRTETLPDGRTKQLLKLPTQRAQTKSQRNKIAPHIYSPQDLKYEEDDLRKQFFSDHPWELARPRVVLETNGDQYANADWSTGLVQPGIPVSGECVVQRQLWLLENIPDITKAESYDIARKEFYAVRQRQQTARRIAVEEAVNMGADFGPNDFAKAMTVESKIHDEWMEWAEKQNMELDARNASFSGQQLSAERTALDETKQVEQGSNPGLPGAGQRQPYAPGRPLSMESPRIGMQVGNDVFAREARRKEAMGFRSES